MMSIRDFKNSIYSEMAGMTKALSNPNRLEILDLLTQGPAPVDYIAKNTDLSVANASQHLQVLKNSKLVQADRRGKQIYYSLSGSDVFQAWCALRRLGFSQNAEISRLVDDYRQDRDSLDTISSEELLERLDSDEVLIIDVRPENEYEQGHIKHAISLPKSSIQEKLSNLPKEKQIIAYCRGPLCVMADDVIQILKKKGYSAFRLEKGYPDWSARGLPVNSPHNNKTERV
jgi:rhodanese-related sulfurtransferase